MTLHEHRGTFEAQLTPLVDWCADRGVDPNTLSVLGLATTVASALVFYLTPRDRAWLLGVGAAVLVVGATLDSLDGLVARQTGQASALGDYLDHAFDRFADVAVLLGFAFSTWVPLEIGLLAIVGTLLTSYMGTQAQAVGVGRDYGGLVGRADRMMVLVWAPALQVVLELAYDAGLTLGGLPRVNLVAVGLAWIALAGNITAIQRFWAAFSHLRDDEQG